VDFQQWLRQFLLQPWIERVAKGVAKNVHRQNS
jgi:hypothetical protein